jgi:predicted transcriptional regulator
MNDYQITIRLPDKMGSVLDTLSEKTDRPRSYHLKQALSRYLETEADIIMGIENALHEVKAGQTIPHDDVMAEIDAHIDQIAKATGQN